jgi:hypothetical protein
MARWDSSIVALYDTGSLSLLRLYKHNQWEDLDVNFKFVINNQVYIEREDEFDGKVQPKQTDLDPSIFRHKLF